ncbi:DUF948 domain-containing protein [Paenibacillus sp. HB172176]|uniref:DUF948 domain-containing protein n=1 Tax=Paenibacillus sp. HB172176 TaxID=2493690 RepID=UPI001F0D6224|nr:DUF948 domain-containing protein [Paenibacillus sp. HB172176]
MEWSATLAAVAFAVLVAGVLIALRALLAKLARIQATADRLQNDLHHISGEVSSLLQPAEQSIRIVQKRLDATEGLFSAVRQAGDSIEHTVSAVEKAASMLSTSAVKHAENIARKKQGEAIVQWTELGLTAWQLWNSSRSAKAAKVKSLEQADPEANSANPESSR